MELNPGQLSTLKKMGIPVWELRSDNSAIEDIANDVISDRPSEQLLQCNCIVMMEYQTNNDQSQRLLTAMLAAIGITQRQTAIVTPEQLPQLQGIESQNKVLLVLGETLAQTLFDSALSRGTIHQLFASELSSIVSFSLEELLHSPEHKALVWQDLQLVKASLSR